MSIERKAEQRERTKVLPDSNILYDQQWFEGKVERHNDNLRRFTGYWHGTYYYHGVGQTNSDERTRIILRKRGIQK